ncbi:restriction endonuclease subunit S, partial [Georgenia sp. MJ170]|uniref:restriction endonuclease subunit S n=1 Tax=Georgenia sunbinii TaxID=3117728 RepID=UPI002F26A831
TPVAFLARGRFWVNNHAHVVTGTAESDTRFLSHLLSITDLSGYLTGSTQPKLSRRALDSIQLVIPPVDTQRAIAEVLGALDDKIAANELLAQRADELASALFADDVRGATLSGKTFDDVASVRGGGTPSSKVPEYWGGEIAWATPTDVTALQGPYLFDTARKITATGLANCASDLHPAGSILMTSRATIGAFAIAGRPTAVNQGFIVVFPDRDTPGMWLFHEMRSRITEFTSMANGATFLELSRGNFKRFRVRLAEQSAMRDFDERARALHRRAASALHENLALAATRDALLPGLMSGALRVKDAERVAEWMR